MTSAQAATRWRGDPVVAAIALLSLPLFLYGLGSTYLWQDEAQTALLGRSVLEHGAPMVGRGADSLSAVQGLDEGIGGLYFQVSWLQAYLAAASFAIFGESSWSARLPFALAGWLCVPLVAWAIRAAGADRTAARTATLLLALSVPFIVCSRQARYYAPTALLTLVVTGLYAVVHARGAGTRPARIPSLALGLAASLLALSLDLVAIGILGALAGHWLISQRGERRWSAAFWVPWGAACAVMAGWIAASMTAASRQEHAGLGPLVRRLRTGAFFYVGQLNATVTPMPLLLGLAALFRRPSPGSDASGLQETRQAAALWTIVAAGGICGAMLSPFRYFRYAVPVVPLVIGLAAIGLAAIWSLGRVGKAVATVLVVALVSTNLLQVWSHALLSTLARASGAITVRERPVDRQIPLALLLSELRDPPRGPIAAVAEYLQAHAAPGDAVVVGYGELPLKFHTRLRVYGGETAQFPPAGVRPEWIWPRHLVPYREIRPALAWMRETLEGGDYDAVTLAAIDRRWENREDPREHIFLNPGPDGPPVVLYRRRR